MIKNMFRMPVLVLAAALSALAQQPTKVGIIHIQNAIISTKDGQKAAQELDQRAAPKRKELETLNGDIQRLQNELRAKSNTISEELKANMMRDIDTKTKQYNRRLEDAQAEFDQEQQKVLGELGGKLMAVIEKFAADNGYAVILDVSNPQTPVLFASTSVDVTRDIVGLYDKNAPSAAKPMAPAPTSSAPASMPAKPVAMPPAIPAAKKK